MIRINLLPKEERAKRHTQPTIRLPRVGAVAPFVALAGLGLAIVTVATVQSRQVAKLQHDVDEARAETERYKPQLEKIRERGDVIIRRTLLLASSSIVSLDFTCIESRILSGAAFSAAASAAAVGCSPRTILLS